MEAPVPAFTCLALLAFSAREAAAQEPRFEERLEVSRVVVDARVVDPRGRPLLGLTPRDFRLRVDGQAVPLESLQWVAEAAPAPETVGIPSEPAAGPLIPRGRLIVFLFQKELGGFRLPGLIRMKERAAAFVDSLGTQDRAAVLIFDSHLRLFLDFTEDKREIQDVLRRRLLREWPRPVPAGPFPSLAAHLDRGAARRAAAPETALLVLARALRPLPGAKSVLFFGSSLGRLSGGQVLLDADYEPARQALAAARAAVFALDVSDADYHTLEVALEKVAVDTGGFYMKTHDFPLLAMSLVEGALHGHYVLAFESPTRRRGLHALDVDLVGRKGTVLARNTFLD